MIYTKMKYAELKASQPDLSFKELNTKLSEDYKNLTDEEK